MEPPLRGTTIQLDVHGDMNEIVTKVNVDDEIDESRRRTQSAGLKGRPNQLCDPSVEIFTPRHPSFG